MKMMVHKFTLTVVHVSEQGFEQEGHADAALQP